MRTSVDIPDPLLHKARLVARRRKTTLRSILLEGLRRVLEKEGQKKPPYELPDESFGQGGPVEGLAPTDWERIRAIAYEGRGG
jgi:hypothetical protein